MAEGSEQKAAERTDKPSSSLVCQQILVPPLQQTGDLSYRNSQTAWQVAFDRTGRTLAVCYGAPDPCIRIWTFQDDTWTLAHTLEGIQTRTIRSVDFAPIRAPLCLASASFDGTIAIWECSGGGSDSQNNEWECIAQLEGHDNEVKCVRWNETGSLLASSGRDKTVWIWECFLAGTVGGSSSDSGGDFECLAVLHGHEGDVKSLVFAPNHGQWGDGGEILLSASYDDTIRCWAEDAGEWYCATQLAGVHSNTIWSLSLAPSGGRLVSASADGSMAIYKCYTKIEDDSAESGTWKCVGKLADAHADAIIYCTDYAPVKAGHGRIVSGGSDHQIHIYREAAHSGSDQPLFVLETSVDTGTAGDVNCVRWHPLDGSLVASAGDDGIVRIWKYKIVS